MKFSRKHNALRFVTGLSILSTLLVGVDNAHASKSWQPETLRSISQLQVRVKKVRCGGASENRLRSVVEKYLSRKGIPIKPNPSNARTDRYIYIYAGCSYSNFSPAYAYNIELEIIQPVTLNGRRTKSVTYTVPNIFGTATGTGFSDNEARLMKELLDEFITDWKANR